MIDWVFLAAWCVWLGWMGIAGIRWQSLGFTPWAIGAVLVVVHSFLIRRRITRLQDAIASRGLTDDETRHAREAFEGRLQRVIGSLKPVFYAAAGIAVTVTVVTALLSSMSMPRKTDFYGSMKMPDALVAVVSVSALYLLGFSFAVFEVPKSLRDFFPEDLLSPRRRRWPSDFEHDTPTTLNLHSEDDEPRRTP